MPKHNFGLSWDDNDPSYSKWILKDCKKKIVFKLRCNTQARERNWAHFIVA